MNNRKILDEEEINQKIIMYYRQGMIQADMAKRLGISQTTVCMRIKKLLKMGLLKKEEKGIDKDKFEEIETIEQESALKQKKVYKLNKNIIHILMQTYVKRKEYQNAIDLLEEYSKDYNLTPTELQNVRKLKERLEKEKQKEQELQIRDFLEL